MESYQKSTGQKCLPLFQILKGRLHFCDLYNIKQQDHCHYYANRYFYNWVIKNNIYWLHLYLKYSILIIINFTEYLKLSPDFIKMLL